MKDSKQIANEKTERALAFIERAQLLLGAACGELASITFASEQWRDIGEQYDAINALWHRVNESIPRHKIDLDSDTKARLAKEQS